MSALCRAKLTPSQNIFTGPFGKKLCNHEINIMGLLVELLRTNLGTWVLLNWISFYTLITTKHLYYKCIHDMNKSLEFK